MAGEEVMNTFIRTISLAALWVGLAAPARSASSPQAAPAAKPGKGPSGTAQPKMDRGERAFNANCSRCHYAPETLNPRITGTVIRHMRVRANLSAQDERDILHFLNP